MSKVDNVYSRSVKGSFWVIAIRVVVQVLSFARLIVLARILEIEEMALLGIAMLMIQILETFTTTGFRAALIQKKDQIDGYLNSAWTMGIVRALVLFSILYVAAPYVSMLKVSAEKVSDTIAIIRVIGIMLLIKGLGNIATIYFQKELQFHKQFIYQITGTLADALVTIVIALVYRSVWALVIGKLVGEFVRCVLGYLIYPFKPRLKFDPAKAASLWSFGKWILGGTILAFLMTQGDDIFVLGYLGAFSLALYQMAYKFASIPATEISNIVGHVTFPAFSKIQDDIPRLRDAYLKVLQATSFLSIPVGGLIVILAPDFVRLFLTDKWLLAILPMQILAVQGIFRSLGTLRGPLLNALGRPDISTKLLLVRVLLFAILIYPLTKRWGISGTSLSIVLVSTVVYPIGFLIARKLIQAKTRQLLKPVAVPLASTLLMIASIWLYDIAFQNEIGFVLFFVKALIGAAVYFIAIAFFEKFLNYGIVNIFKSQLNVFTARKANWGADDG